MRCAPLLLALLGCTPAKQPLHVFAASSLTDAFARIEVAFEAAHPTVDLIVSTAGSQTLRMQIEQGAQADLFASANPDHADALVNQGLANQPQTFARNALALVVPADNPAQITQLSDLPRAQRVVLGDAAVPAGQYARQALNRAGISDTVRVVSRESNVRLVLAKVVLGEADAALVYRTDARDRPGVRVIDLPWPITADYQLVTLRPGPAAASFRAFLLGPGRTILAQQGFQ